MRTLAIGDIHGCLTALTTLINVVRPAADDHLIFLGDYIDRGPDSRAVIEWMIHRTSGFRATFLRGNHEVMILDTMDDSLKAKLWQSYGGFEMLISYGAEYRDDWQAAIPESHWDFLKRTQPFLETDTHIFAHAGLEADVDLADQHELVLYWEFFDNLHPHKSGKKFICGHSSQPSGRILDTGFAACIDTGAVTGGWLTCFDPATGEYWQANEKGGTRGGRPGA